MNQLSRLNHCMLRCRRSSMPASTSSSASPTVIYPVRLVPFIFAAILKTGKLDLILCSMVSDPKIEITPLIQRPLVLVVPRGHRLFSRSSIDIQELKGERFIAHSRDTIMHDRVSSRQKPGEATPKPARESAERMTGREGFSPQLS